MGTYKDISGLHKKTDKLLGEIFLSFELWKTYENTLSNKRKVDYINIHLNYSFTILKASVKEFTIINLAKLFDKNSYISISKLFNNIENNLSGLNKNTYQEIKSEDILQNNAYIEKNIKTIDSIKNFRDKNICHSDKKAYTSKYLTINSIEKLINELEIILNSISLKLNGSTSNKDTLKYKASEEYNKTFKILLNKESKRLKSIKKETIKKIKS